MFKLAKITFGTAIAILVLTPLFSEFAHAQSNDSIFLKSNANGGSSVRRGRISQTSPNGVTIQVKGKAEEIPSQKIKKISYAGEPRQLGTARGRIETGRYDDGLTELAKISGTVDSDFIQSEIDFLKAFCQAQKSLKGGDVTAQQAGIAIRNFTQKYPDSYHFYPATDLLGKLLVAIGKPEFAEKEFAKISRSQWPAMTIKGFFERGNALLLTGNLETAKQCFESIATIDANDDESQQFKMVAQCQLAKIMALSGQLDSGQAIVEKIIKDENPDNAMLFAYAYNALGTCYLQAQQPKPAAIAFLHTELLYSNELSPHAEALYNLAKIWPVLEETDRANRARQALKSRYRNTYWALQL